MKKSSNGKKNQKTVKTVKASDLKHIVKNGGDDSDKLYFDDDVNISLPYNLIQLVGNINPQTAAQITEMLLTYDYKNNLSGLQQPIYMLINSGGGEISPAWQICDIMNAIKTPVYTIGTGMIASSALMVFINGEKGHRVLSSNTSVMSHQYSWGVEGRHSELISAKNEFDNIFKRMVDHYHVNTGLTRDVIKKELLGDSDTWLTARQAKKLKLVDKVSTFKNKNPLELIKELKPENQRARIIKTMEHMQEMQEMGGQGVINTAEEEG